MRTRSLLPALLLALPAPAWAGFGDEEMIAGAFLTLFFVAAMFLVCREFMCWYWKINEQVELLKQIAEHLGAQPAPVGAAPRAASAAAAVDVTCAGCGKHHPADDAGAFCDACGAAL